MDIEFKKGDVTKVTHKKFTEALVEAGWEVVKKEPAKKAVKKKVK